MQGPQRRRAEAAVTAVGRVAEPQGDQYVTEPSHDRNWSRREMYKGQYGQI